MTAGKPDTLKSLRETLAARGAKPHSRMSDLSRYLLAHQKEIEVLLKVDGYGWADLAAMLAEDKGLTDETGRPVSAESAKLAWSRLRRREMKQAAAIVAPTAGKPISKPLPATPVAPEAPIGAGPAITPSDRIRVSDADPGLPFARTEKPPLVIRPARPRGMGGAPTSTAPLPALPLATAEAPPVRDEGRLREQLDELGRRQSAKKLPLPDPL